MFSSTDDVMIPSFRGSRLTWLLVALAAAACIAGIWLYQARRPHPAAVELAGVGPGAAGQFQHGLRGPPVQSGIALREEVALPGHVAVIERNVVDFRQTVELTMRHR
jgi:hypothetical protein